MGRTLEKLEVMLAEVILLKNPEEKVQGLVDYMDYVSSFEETVPKSKFLYLQALLLYKAEMVKYN